MSRGRVFENMGAAWLFKFWNSLGARSSGRSAEIVRFEIPWNFLTVNINLHFWRLRVKITLFRTRAEFTVSLLCEPGRLKLQKENRISGLQKRKIWLALRAHRKRGKSARASPSPHHISLEERSAPLNAQPLTALVWTDALSGMHGLSEHSLT